MQHLKESENAHLGPIIGFGHLVMSEMFLTGGFPDTFSMQGFVVNLDGSFHFQGSVMLSQGLRVFFILSRCRRVIFILSRCMTACRGV